MISQKRAKTVGLPLNLDIINDKNEPKTISDSKICRILGVNLSNDMTWRPHLESGPKALLPSLRKCIGSLKFLGKKIPANCRNTLVKGLVTSLLSYLISVWGGTTGNLQRKAQITLNIAARWVMRLPKITRVSDLMAAAGWLDVEEMTLHSVGMLMWKLINKRTPSNIWPNDTN